MKTVEIFSKGIGGLLYIKYTGLKNKVLFVCILILSSFLLTACVPSISSQKRITTSGEFVKGSVIKGFPENLPLYKNAQTIESFGNDKGYGATFITKDDLTRVTKFYNEFLTKTGWDMNMVKKSEANFVYEIKNAKYQGEVIVNTAADGKKTAITMSVTIR